MVVEFKNSNQFRSYPFLDGDTDSTFSQSIQPLFVDAQLNLYSDLIKEEGEVLVAGVSDISIVRDSTHIHINLILVIAGGLRDNFGQIVLDGTGSGRQPISLEMGEGVPLSAIEDMPEYVTFWVHYDSTKSTTSSLLFDKATDQDNLPPDYTDIDVNGSEFVVSGYFSVSKRELNQLSTPVNVLSQITHTADQGGTIVHNKEACFEESCLTVISSQLCRRIRLANKEPLQLGTTQSEKLIKVAGFTDGQGQIILQEGNNCNVEISEALNRVTFIPDKNAGEGMPCGESEASGSETKCSDLIYTINGAAPDENGAITLSTIKPLQLLGNIDDPGSNGVFNWAHGLVFRVGDWGDFPNSVSCAPPDC